MARRSTGDHAPAAHHRHRVRAVAAVAAAALVVVPTVAVTVFLVASALHFGRGEVVAAAERGGRAVPGPCVDLDVVLAHGAAVVVLPLVRWPAESAAVLDRLAPGVGVGDAALRVTTTAVVAALVLAVALRLTLAARPVEALELLLVATLFAVVTPLVAFGVYFGFWHALRHTGRLLTLPGPDGPPPLPVALRRVAAGAAVPTLAALASMAVVWRLADTGVLAVAVAVLLALTFPHLGAVAALDRRVAGDPIPVTAHPVASDPVTSPTLSAGRSRRRRGPTTPRPVPRRG